MKTLAEHPYEDYYLYVVYHKKEGRKYAVLYPDRNSNLKMTTISYARYLMSVKEGRVLLPNEEVDHIDNNRLNDSIDNLQILTSEKNKAKYKDGLTRNMVKLRCPCCGTIFDRERRETHLIKRGRYTACSRKCSGVFSHKIAKNPNDPDVIRAINSNIVMEYRQGPNT